MTRTEMLAALDKVKRLLAVAGELNHTSFAAMLVGVPLTLAAFLGFSVWPGIICWTISWLAFALNTYLLRQAKALNAEVAKAQQARSDTAPEE
jgi:hypothetical protein